MFQMAVLAILFILLLNPIQWCQPLLAFQAIVMIRFQDPHYLFRWEQHWEERWMKRLSKHESEVSSAADCSD